MVSKVYDSTVEEKWKQNNPTRANKLPSGQISCVMLTQHLLKLSGVLIAHPLQIVFRTSAYAITVVLHPALNIRLEHFE